MWQLPLRLFQTSVLMLVELLGLARLVLLGDPIVEAVLVAGNLNSVKLHAGD